MKIFLITMLFSGFVMANSQLEQKIKELEARVRILEAKQQGSVDSSSGLKVKDMNNNQMQQGMGGARTVSSEQMPALTPEQQAEIQKTLEQYKAKQDESQKLLDELMNEP